MCIVIAGSGSSMCMHVFSFVFYMLNGAVPGQLCTMPDCMNALVRAFIGWPLCKECHEGERMVSGSKSVQCNTMCCSGHCG